jgi:mannosylfructose-6-phosphate phosphatase
LNFPRERVIVSGDSANDLSMFKQGFPGIVVGNGHPELKDLRGESIFQATLPQAGGVLQGLQYWLG